MTMRAALLALSLAAALPACTSSTAMQSTAQMQILTPQQAASCRMLGEAQASSGLYGVLAGSGRRAAQGALLDRAQQMGGNAVVLKTGVAQHGQTNMAADVYRC